MNDRPHSSVSVPSGRQIELRQGGQRAVVVEVGGALRAYSVEDRDLLDGYGEQEMCSVARGQSLIPWPNRLRDGSYELAGESYQLPLTEPGQHNAIHGLIRWVNWAVAERDDARARMEYRLHPQDGYPFTLALAIEYTLDDHGLTVRTSATNDGERSCPYGAGAHPYLTAGTDLIDTCTLRAPGGKWMQTDDRAIPTGAAPVEGTDYDFRTPREIGRVELDTGYSDLVRDDDGLSRVTLKAPGGTGVTLWQDEGYQYLMLFTGDSIPQVDRRRQGLGVEPMTCAPNAFQSGEGLRTLEPGETFSCAWGLSPA